MEKNKFLGKVNFLVLITFIVSLFSNYHVISYVAKADDKIKNEKKESWQRYSMIALSEDDFNINPVIFNIDGNIRGNGNINLNGNDIKIKGDIGSAKEIFSKENLEIKKFENMELLSIPDFYEMMLNQMTDVEKYQGDKFISESKTEIKNNLEVKGNLIINSSILNLNSSIFADNGITINNSLIEPNVNNQTFLVSKSGDITINGSKLNLNGIIYAPNGKVKLNADEVNLKGRIIAKSIELEGRNYNISSDESDFDFLKDEIKPTLQINEPILKEECYVTEEDKISIKGIAKDNVGVSKIEFEHTSEYKKDSNEKEIIGEALGTENWEIADLPLDLGMNYIKVVAFDKSGNISEEKLNIKRNNVEINLKDNVFGVSDDDVEKIHESFVSQSIDDNKTPGYAYDDKKIIILKANNPISEAIEKGIFKIGDILYIGPSDKFLVGFSGKLEKFEKVENNIKFTFSNAEFNQLLGDYVSINSNEKVNFKDDVQFVKSPLINENISELEEGKKGIQFDELQKFILPKISTDSITFGSKTEIVIYDADGKRSTVHDQIRLSGEMKYSNMELQTVFDWDLWLTDIAPKQVKTKYKYDYTDTTSISVGPSIDLTEVVKDFQKAVDANFKNELSFCGISMEGVKMEETVPLVTVGVRFSPGPSLVPSISLNGIQEASQKTKFTPIVTFMVLMDISGELSLSAKISNDERKHVEKGFNLQHVEYKDGVYGGIDSKENKGKERYNLPFGRVMDMYDVESESAANLQSYPVKNIKGTAGGKAQMELGLGAGIGVFLLGVMPALARVVGYVDFNFDGGVDFALENGNFSTDIDLKNFTFETGIKVKTNARVKVPIASFEGTYNKTYKLFSSGKDSKVKIVLTWSDLPRDLDSHLYAPTGDHIYYANRVKYKPNSQEKEIELDYDYTSGFGPETTTINGPDNSGIYSFYVKDFSNQNNSASKNLSNSRAVVKVYFEGKEVETFVVPTNQIGRTWHVFDYDPSKEKIKSVNTITNEYNKEKGEKEEKKVA